LLQVFWLFRILPFNLSFFKPAIAGIVSVASVLLLYIWLPAEFSLINTAIDTSVLFLVYAAVLLALGLTVEEINLFKGAFYKARSVFISKGSD
jgi:hypothetical protein